MKRVTVKTILNTITAGERATAFDYIDKVIPVLMGIFVFFNSIPHTTAIKEISFYLSCLFVIVLACGKKVDYRFKTPLTIPFLLLLAWSCLGFFFALNRPNTIHDIYTHYIKYILVYFLLINFFGTEHRCRILIWIVALSAALFSIGAMIMFYGLERNPFTQRLGFRDMSANYLGFVTIPGLILTLGLVFSSRHLREKVFLSLAFSSTTLATLLTQTRGALIAVIVSVALALWGRWKCLLLIGFGLIVYLVYSPGFLKDRILMESHDLVNNYRVSINRLSLEIISDHPIIGIGFGMQTYADRTLLLTYNEKVPERYRQPLDTLTPCPHNLYLDIAVRVGWVGLGLFFFILAVFFRMAWQTAVQGKTNFIKTWGQLLAGCMLSYLIQAFFADAAFGPQAIMFYTVLALMTILWTLDDKGAGQRLA